MEFKGHTNLRKLPIDFSSLTISAICENENFICHKYYYNDRKLIKHIDFINWKVSFHSYNENNERIELRTYSFDTNPEESDLEGYKRFEYEKGNLIREYHYIIIEKVAKLEYEGKYIYSEQQLVREDFYYPNETYTINYKFEDNNNILTKVYPNNDGNYEYHFDKNGFLKKAINFKRNNYCQVNEYNYRDGRLHKLITYPILQYEKSVMSNDFKLLHQPQFIHENEFYYDSNGMLIKEIKTNIIDNFEIENLKYEYE